MKLQQIEKNIEKEFHVSWYIVVYKLFLGIIEFSFGLTIMLFGKHIARLYLSYAAKELSEDPHDILVHVSESIVPQLFTHNTYIVIYLLLLGSAKIAGAIGLIYKQNWGVDLLVGLTIFMFPFQMYNIILHPAFLDFLYIVIGLFIAFYLIEFKPKAWVSRIFITYIKKVHE